MLEVVRVEDLGKRFFHQVTPRPMTLQERCVGRFQERGPRGEFWGLRHVTFGVADGSALGIVGANGAGKSTLLRLVAGIGRPDEGVVSIEGRANAILDLQSGFHSELTGRENVYLGGLTSGLRRADAHARFDEIVAFSGLERFIDDPLRTYSAGMKMRLGFAVALATLPETRVLLVDEVLTVGDAEFGARCLERIQDFRRAGGSVLLVSHQLEVVQRFCDRALWLKDGHVALTGTPGEVVARYLANEVEQARSPLPSQSPVTT